MNLQKLGSALSGSTLNRTGEPLTDLPSSKISTSCWPAIAVSCRMSYEVRLLFCVVVYASEESTPFGSLWMIFSAPSASVVKFEYSS